ncbi:DUF2797 domain-containing protein [Arthrobacter sp. ATA002]|uniref:DUF2797 domain-containing protein n=1 Tax=Arthrobacter sp. ATA002 TaxID=2991715 RepID=UPI0022A66E1C|nr:DUF2797 domain-containing protein [Arthrobacter sp. ATA002]WAP52516.1 DUF2797 domain-containing protein [Arthrobacter sp. ATA002]
MTEGRYLCAGVSWDDAGPRLSLSGPGGDQQHLRLDPGTLLSYRVLPGDSGALKFCLGPVKVLDRRTRTHEPCPGHSAAERGYQCGPCFARDDWRMVHNSHRSGIASPGLKLYLAQPHWLYVATFADGTTKVGTAADGHKRLRLTEQGAVAAQYIARAANGIAVRVLEDLVSADAGLVQTVRSEAKAAALVHPLDTKAVDRINAGHAANARLLLERSGEEGFSVVEETWRRPGQAQTVLGAAGAVPYPLDPGSGEHGMAIEAVLGGAALVRVAGAEIPFIANLARLKGRRLHTGSYQTRLPALQTALF